jgi:prepilin-type N-terminal cleavage/methylation domain-containing protein/prepilin-type processing-associated H-X9-DG protein
LPQRDSPLSALSKPGVKNSFKSTSAFTLIELLMVIAVIGILAALLLPALSRAKAKAQRTACMNNLRQINLGIRMYSDDSNDASPSPGSAAGPTNFVSLYSAYKQLMKNYVGVNGASSPQDKLFACPADKFYPNHIFYDDTGPTVNVQKSLHDEPFVDFSSYSFNGGDGRSEVVGAKKITITRPGLGNVKLSAVKHPSRTVLIAEASALAPWSWHEPLSSDFWYNDAKNMVSFVDGHVRYIKMFLDITPQKGLAVFYNPPANYDYQWTPD